MLLNEHEEMKRRSKELLEFYHKRSEDRSLMRLPILPKRRRWIGFLP